MKRSYISLWLLLFVALGIVATASCLDKITLAGHDFKTASFARELTRIPEAPNFMNGLEPLVEVGDSVDADSTAVVAPGVTFPVAVDTASKTILFFGDSMLEGLSPRLAAYCEQNGHKLYSVIWYSSTTGIWGACDTLSTFIRRYDPDYIVACLGANELFVRDIASKRKAPMKHLLDEIGDRPLLWIGPPNWKEDTGINDFIKSTLKPGQFFTSNGMKFQRKKDGAHPTAASAAEWMDSVVRWIPDSCAHPIRLDLPMKDKARPQRLILLQPVK